MDQPDESVENDSAQSNTQEEPGNNSRTREINIAGKRDGMAEFEITRQRIEDAYSRLAFEVGQLLREVQAIASEVLSVRKAAVNALKNVLKSKIGRTESRAKTLKDLIEIIRQALPQLIRKISMFEVEAQRMLKSIDTSNPNVAREVEVYAVDLSNRLAQLKSNLGPIGSKLIGIASTYASAMKKIEDIKKAGEKAVSIYKKFRAAGAAGSALQTIVPVVLVAIAIFGVIILLDSFSRVGDNPGAIIETVINTGCIDPSDPECFSRLTTEVMEQSFNGRL